MGARRFIRGSTYTEVQRSGWMIFGAAWLCIAAAAVPILALFGTARLWFAAPLAAGAVMIALFMRTMTTAVTPDAIELTMATPFRRWHERIPLAEVRGVAPAARAHGGDWGTRDASGARELAYVNLAATYMGPERPNAVRIETSRGEVYVGTPEPAALAAAVEERRRALGAEIPAPR